jgi:mono/diheme cytochrome c family protein/glucose/arabinose dehydrogenase
MRKSLLFFVLLMVVPVFAQNGDNPGEVQMAPLKDSDIPPAPILSPEESLKTFKPQPGFKIELVASEPLIQAPVAMQFHPDGSLYVLEMRGFMPNVDGKGEDQPIGRVSVLYDTDGDGRMDRSTTFLDGLVMPRAIALAYDGVLVAEPPNLWFCKDTNGDGVCDEKTLLASDYGSQKNPEHTANGLLWGLDNWIYNANHTNRLRRVEGKWIQEATATISGRGQWGISQDDFGRLVFNSNSDYLRGDLVPPELLFRNPNLASPFGANVQFDKSQETFPIRPNPGVNRGYQKGQLRANGTLASYTAACGPVIYRGDQFDPSFYGCAFVCEPAGNFVRCSRLTESNGIIAATNAFPQSEFLASHEERFRPVNLYNGPDGALYVVDLHRGVLQHRVYVTTYLRKQYLSRGLEGPVDFGRIYRIVQEGRPRRKIEPTRAQTPELVNDLTKPNGWTRETAQRLLVERGDAAAVEPLRALARSDRNATAPIHALWTLHAMGKLDSQTIVAAFASPNARTRSTATRLAGERAATNLAAREVLARSADDSDAFVQLQAAFWLGPISTNTSALEALVKIVKARASEPLFRDAVISGLHNEEIALLELLLKRADLQTNANGFDKFLGRLASAGAASRINGVNRILELAAEDNSWRRTALMDGLLSSTPTRSRGRTAAKPKVTRLDAEPAALATLRKDPALDDKVAALEETLTWPGKAGAVETAVRPLTTAEKEQFESGKQTYLLTCAACHQPHGLGQEGLAPALVDSEWVTGSEKRLARIVLQGLRGPITANGKQISLEMPPLGILEDQQIAAILTYIRREWNHTASPVTTEFVAKTREETASREEPWNEADLLKIK